MRCGRNIENTAVGDFVEFRLHYAIVNGTETEKAEKKIHNGFIFVRESHGLATFGKFLLGKEETEEGEEDAKKTFQNETFSNIV